jgi:hypothetical protein
MAMCPVVQVWDHTGQVNAKRITVEAAVAPPTSTGFRANINAMTDI